MLNLVSKLDNRLYPGIDKNWDDDLFRAEILNYLTPDAKLLDLGAGAGIVEQMNFRGLASHICGVDPDPRVATNPYLDEGRVGYGESIPYDDEQFDVMVADNVLEHLENPEAVFSEAARVLKPGGIFLAKTPNKYHYMPTIARCTPHKFHQFVNKLRGRDEDDTFPTQYLANSPADVEKLALQTGLEVVETILIEGRPEYLRMFWGTYLMGWGYEKLVNTLPGLQRFRILMIAVLSKPHSQPQTTSKAA